MTYNSKAAKSATTPPTPPAAVASTTHAPLVLDVVAADPVAVPVPLPLGEPDVAVVEDPPLEEVPLEVALAVAAMKTPPMILPGFSTITSFLALLMKESMVAFGGL